MFFEVPEIGGDMPKMIKLGKKPAKTDSRNLKLATIMKVPVAVPSDYDFDISVGKKIPKSMFGNDTYGNCVIASRGHQTRMLEWVEHQKLVSVTERGVVKEYFKETGGMDEGLVMLDSLKLWRKVGWKTNASYFRFFREPFKIHAFAEVDPHNRSEVEAGLFLLSGLQLGLNLPYTAAVEFDANKPWTKTTDPPGTWGGHCVTAVGYDLYFIHCVTWGQKQSIGWSFFRKYCDEAYAIVDEAEKWVGETQPGIDVEKLEDYLNSL